MEKENKRKKNWKKIAMVTIAAPRQNYLPPDAAQAT